jgi:hypothetical protein
MFITNEIFIYEHSMFGLTIFFLSVHILNGLMFYFNFLGDSGYAVLPWVMTPYTPFRNEVEANFNGVHSVIRQSVERGIGLLKTRFR